MRVTSLPTNQKSQARLSANHVIGLLDQQKRDSLGARSAIRWLEIKFRHGSRFIRSQRPHERTHLPLIKYPKRKDKEAW
ncbi:hypothetical protein E2C01_036195 [Portunus trituberculatus]|uniref:Uncharacterized protein n=1 Tax=Portunus trituberculatus TaxID=210409 RepID=A0A5B7F826_PORTR|nr:hypothetical protein [Portunus trituberculatus]